MSKKYDANLMRDRQRYIEQQERKQLSVTRRKDSKKESTRGPQFNMVVVDEMSKQFSEVARQMALIGESSDQARRRIANMALELEREVAKRRAEEERELAEGIEYVKRSLGVIE